MKALHITIRVVCITAGGLAGLVVGGEWKAPQVGAIIGGAIGDGAAELFIEWHMAPTPKEPLAPPLPIVPVGSPAAPREFTSPVRSLIVQVQPG